MEFLDLWDHEEKQVLSLDQKETMAFPVKMESLENPARTVKMDIPAFLGEQETLVWPETPEMLVYQAIQELREIKVLREHEDSMENLVFQERKEVAVSLAHLANKA